jgi:hypothetical protein
MKMASPTSSSSYLISKGMVESSLSLQSPSSVSSNRLLKCHKYRFQSQKSVSFFDIDKVHYYNSEDCSLTCSSGSSSDDEDNNIHDCDTVKKNITSLIALKTSSEKSGAYFRIDLTYKIPAQHIARLQDTFNADIDLVGEFFEDVYMYELWKRK